MRLGRKKKCSACGRGVSRQHKPGCPNDKRDCQFKKRKKKEVARA